MRAPAILLLSSILFPIINAQAVADGLIVPFTSVLPACASKCGKLFDVQGACTPPNIATTSSTCFCADPRLTPFLDQGTSGVSSVCTSVSCTATADLQKIQSWYASYCNEQVPGATTTSSAAQSTKTSSGGTGTATQTPSQSAKHQSWMDTHWRWVVMVIVIAVGMVVIWVGASILRKRYIRKKEREIELRPPVAWGPHQMQNQTGGYTYGDGVLNASGGRAKEAKTMDTETTTSETRGVKKWLRKNRN